jgi:hypothetical protein
MFSQAPLPKPKPEPAAAPVEKAGFFEKKAAPVKRLLPEPVPEPSTSTNRVPDPVLEYSKRP